MPSSKLANTIALFISVIVTGTIGYRVIEGWSWLDSVWMVVITLTTIGYGEAQPLTPDGRWFTLALIGGGLGVYSYAVAQLSQYFIGGDLARDLKRRQRMWLMNSLEDHFIIVGYGRLGQEVAAELTHAGRRVVVIDTNHKAIEACEKAGLTAIEGDAAHDETLRSVGIERAEGLAVATASNAVNVLITLSARQLSPQLMILTRVDGDEAASKAKRAGASSVISPYGLGGTHMALGLLRPDARSFVEQATVRGHQQMAFEDITLGGKLQGTLGELALRARFGVLVVAVRRPGGALEGLPDKDTSVAAGDVVVAVGRPSDLSKFAETATRTA